ncbi:MAG: hypothetical protein ACREPX_02570 [Rhodanobacteraceae bacterium]
MRYDDGQLIEPGDIVQIDGCYRGLVVASMDTQSYLVGQEGWAYLGSGIMVDTDFGGMVHYTSEASDELVLIERPAKS